MNKTLLVVLIVVLGLGALVFMKKDKEVPAVTPESDQVEETTEDTENEEGADEDTAESEVVPTAPAASAAPATPTDDIEETLSALTLLFDESYDDSDVEDDLDGGEFDAINNSYEL